MEFKRKLVKVVIGNVNPLYEARTFTNGACC